MRKQILDAIIEEKCLLKHPFYQAWNMGTLTHADLAVYATQYGEFIDCIATGWEIAGDAMLPTKSESTRCFGRTSQRPQRATPRSRPASLKSMRW